VFFPQALLPLHIFEPRYRAMLHDVLTRNRVFAVAQLDRNPPAGTGAAEPSHLVATAGIIRACQKNDDGTSDLLLQGLCRVEIVRILNDEPYRFIAVRPLLSVAGGTNAELRKLRNQTAQLFDLKRKLGLPQAEEMNRLVQSVVDPDAFADLSAFALCEDGGFKQRLLETLATKERLQLIARQLRREIALTKLQRRLQGGLPDDRIARN
jgi:ATP-dependent Lon protease